MKVIFFTSQSDMGDLLETHPDSDIFSLLGNLVVREMREFEVIETINHSTFPEVDKKTMNFHEIELQNNNNSK